jgi:osmotically-inducible protein OsmY
MKTDAQIKSDVSAELAWDTAVDATRIGVAVKDGVVSLSGEVETYLQKHAAERAARRIPGVRGIAMDVVVRLAPDHARTDAEIAEAALNALRWHSLVPEDKVKVKVEDGWVTLTGELDWGYQSASAEQAVHPLVGVTGVSNQIRLRERANPAGIRQDIEAALRRHAEREARHIAVDVDGGVVTLRGVVHSLPEHEAVLGTAYASKGVTRVVDALEVVT